MFHFISTQWEFLITFLFFVVADKYCGAMFEYRLQQPERC